MKKEIKKSLNLNKRTVTNLDSNTMNYVRGGDSEPGVTCKTCPTIHTLCEPTTICSGICADTDWTC